MSMSFGAWSYSHIFSVISKWFHAPHNGFNSFVKLSIVLPILADILLNSSKAILKGSILLVWNDKVNIVEVYFLEHLNPLHHSK